MRCFDKKTCWFICFCASAFLMLVALGAWQVQRLLWKENLIARAERKLAEPPLILTVKWERFLPPDGKVHPNEPLAFASAVQYEQCCDEICLRLCEIVEPDEAREEFTRVRVAGWPDYANEIRLQAKYHDGKAGYRVLTPVRIGQDRAVLVDRGWVDAKASYAPPAPAEAAAGFTGVVRAELKRPMWFLPQNNPEKNLWFWTDIPVMTSFVRRKQGTNAPSYMPYILQQTESEAPVAEGQPFPISDKPEFRNDHLGYAITWFALALVVAVMGAFYVRKQCKAL